MATLTDTFTGTDGTDLSAHTADTGESWTKVTGDGTHKFILKGNRLEAAGGTGAEYYCSWTPASPDYDVEVVLDYLSDQPAYYEFGGRMNTAGTAGYVVAIDDFSNTMYLVDKTDDSTIGTPVALNRADDTIKLEMRGTTLKVYRNGSEVISGTDGTTTAAGRVWLGKYGGPGATDGWMFVGLTATDAAGDTTVTSPVADGIGDLVAPVVAAGSAVTSPVAAGVADLIAPALSAGATVTAPAASAVGDLATPGASGSSGWTDISGETASTLLLDAGEVGYEIRCLVTATNVAGDSDPEPSNTVGPVADEAGVTAPAADGVASFPSPAVSAGATVTAPALDGTADIPAPVAASSDWADVSGATASTYELQPDDVGFEVRCLVVASNAAGDSDPEASNTLGPVEEASADATVNAPPMAATGDIPTASLPVSVEVTPGPLSGTGGMVAPTATVPAGSTVTAPAAGGAADMPAPAVTASSSITAPSASAAGDMPAPTVVAAEGTVAPAAQGTGSFPAPAVTAGAAVTAPAAAASGSMPVPNVQGGIVDATVEAPAATAQGDMPAPDLNAVFVWAAIPSGGRIARGKEGRAELVGVT